MLLKPELILESNIGRVIFKRFTKKSSGCCACKYKHYSHDPNSDCRDVLIHGIKLIKYCSKEYKGISILSTIKHSVKNYSYYATET